MLWQTAFRVLDARPVNTFTTLDEIQRQVAEQIPQVREADLVRALGEIHQRFGIVCGWVERSDISQWGMALRKKITTLPPGVLLVIGVKLEPDLLDIIATLP